MMTTLFLIPVPEDTDRYKQMLHLFKLKSLFSSFILEWNNKPCYALDSSVCKLVPSTQSMVDEAMTQILKGDILRACCFSFLFQVEFQGIVSILAQTIMFFDFQPCPRSGIFDNRKGTLSPELIVNCMTLMQQGLQECCLQKLMTFAEKSRLEVNLRDQLAKDGLIVKTSVIQSPLPRASCCFCQGDCSPYSQACKRCMQTGRYLTSVDFSSFIIDNVLLDEC